jgi:hypothetical protein
VAGHGHCVPVAPNKAATALVFRWGVSTGLMERYSVGDRVDMLVNGRPVDTGTVREIVEDRETGATVVVIDWQTAGRLRQMLGELRKRGSATPRP